jgi:hypothetical protein
MTTCAVELEHLNVPLGYVLVEHVIGVHKVDAFAYKEGERSSHMTTVMLRDNSKSTR